tara:strand:+ start:33 stop:200 length:168 start_codon:yes stop_codon:yes gene_type:complete
LKKKSKIIRCSQCDEEFYNGYDYRMHWEEEHFYPYLGKTFDYERAKKDVKTKRYK